LLGRGFSARGRAAEFPATGFFGHHTDMLITAIRAPLGQQLWLDWFETLKEFPPMQKELQPQPNNGSDEGQWTPERLVRRREWMLTKRASWQGAPVWI